MYNQNPDPTRPRPTDSWIEISPRPSTSSVPSPNEEHSHAASLRARRDLNARRRGRLLEQSPLNIQIESRQPSVGSSSQEEYDESESESDRIMTSSNEGVQSSTSESGMRRTRDGIRDLDDGASDSETALADQTCFTPQPNAFSHPPSSSRSRNEVPGSYFPASARPSTGARRSTSSQRQRQGHSPYGGGLSTSHLPDHDAALRASLNTLLSCAAAARSLPKDQETTPRPSVAQASRAEPSILRVVPESVVMGLDRPSLQNRRISSTPSSSNRAPSPVREAQAERQKRKSTRSSSKERQRLAKKPKQAQLEEINTVSPTLLTWVVSAGVIVIVSALSFSAGYKVGQETARFDAMTGGETGNCAKEAGRAGLGLRRLRWSAAASAVTA